MARWLDSSCLVAERIEVALIPSLAADGVALLINNRADFEEPGQPRSSVIAAAAAGSGVEYLHLPVVGGIDPSTLDAARRALRSSKKLTMLFCKSGMRSALLWAAARVADGLPVEEALAATKRAGFEFQHYRPMLNQIAAKTG